MQTDQNNFRERYRAISWWLTYDDFRWPDLDIADKIRWKADNMAKNGVNMAIIFGAHWRWDWMPVWTMLHDLIATMADELHQRNIKLFDHHSAVLAQRYNTREELRELRKRHPHHISPAPTFAAGASWEYKGQKLDDWCMRNVTDGKVNYLPMYQTVEFCINNPGFVEAYLDYAKTLFAETNIDGFNCDDGFYYAGFKSCGCEHCRRMFRENYGYELPPADDLTFWGNWDNEAWRRWVDMRHESAGAFLRKVKEVIPANAGLCTCLSGSVNSSGNGTGQGFPMVEACNVLMIEMTKNMPDLNGKAYGPLPTQLYQIAHGEEHNIPVLSCGYSYTDASADVVWAFSKFLGADTWISTNKGRLSLRFSDWGKLPDDSELCGTGYRFEKANPELFSSQSDPDVGVYYSDASRRYSGGSMCEYVADYRNAVIKLFQAGYNVSALTHIPAPGKCKALVLASVAALSQAERDAVAAFAAGGGIVLISGPCGVMDSTGSDTVQFTEQYDYVQKIGPRVRENAFPDHWFPGTPRTLDNAPGWTVLAENIYYNPVRFQADSAPDIAEVAPELPRFEAAGWFMRKQRNNAGNVLLHGFAEDFDIGFAEDIEALRRPDAPWGNRIINYAAPKNTATELEFNIKAQKAELFTPLCKTTGSVAVENDKVRVNLPEDCFYFLVKITE